MISEPLTRWVNVPQDEEVRRRGEGERGRRGERGGGRRVEREERMRRERWGRGGEEIHNESREGRR